MSSITPTQQSPVTPPPKLKKEKGDSPKGNSPTLPETVQNALHDILSAHSSPQSDKFVTVHSISQLSSFSPKKENQNTESNTELKDMDPEKEFLQEESFEDETPSNQANLKKSDLKILIPGPEEPNLISQNHNQKNATNFSSPFSQESPTTTKQEEQK